MYDGPERRDKPRLSVNQPVTLTVISDDNSSAMRGRLVDVADSGLGVFVESAVALGAVVEVRADGGSVYGEVQHCAGASGGGFRIGIVVEEGIAGEWLTPRERASGP
jgi:hypothetical protein